MKLKVQDYASQQTRIKDELHVNMYVRESTYVQ